ncbi:hypothetical protein BURPS1710b_0470 [Burkholderia pseudomallei 1710b]|uniref:Uncharacterized protein n=1 Tax=Burkholderia pseudomallei (strain 1710b) TaxID=320372 RepID=Q3JX20_BURP1|nr:hypothetical protein BURPS1710b_0470 [Burkholderia pseudomallei 1710b]
MYRTVARLASADLLHDRNQLLRVVRIGCVAGLLHSMREAFRVVARVQHARVARIVFQQVRVIGHRMLVRVVCAELRDHAVRLAVHVFGGDGRYRAAGPALRRLDAEHVVARFAVRAADLALAPAGFERRLADDEARRNAGGRARRLRGERHLLDERIRLRGVAVALQRRRERARRRIAARARERAVAWRPIRVRIRLRERVHRREAAFALRVGRDVRVAQQLLGERVGHADALRRHLLRELLIEHRRVHLRRARIEQAVRRRRVAHALQHHLREHRVELARDHLHTLARRSRRGLRAQRVEPLNVEREALRQIVRFRESRHLDDLQVRAKRARRLHRLQDRHQIRGRRAERVERLHHVGEVRARRHHPQRAIVLLELDLRLLRHHRLPVRERPRLRHHGLRVDDDRQIAVRDRAVLQRHHLVHHDRARARVQDHLRRGPLRAHLEILQPRHERDLLRRIGGRGELDRAAVERRRRARAEARVHRGHDALRGAVIHVVQLQLQHAVHLRDRVRHRALDDRAAGDAAGRELVHLHAAAVRARARAAHRHVALRERVHLAVGALQRREQQRAAAQALRIAERRYRHVDRLTRPRERRQRRRHHHRGDVLQLHVRHRRRAAAVGRAVVDRDAEVREHVRERLRRERRLHRLVARAVEADDEAVADQRVVAHALDLREVLQALRARRGGREREREHARGERAARRRPATRSNEGAHDAREQGTHRLHHGAMLRKKRCSQPIVSASLM